MVEYKAVTKLNENIFCSNLQNYGTKFKVNAITNSGMVKITGFEFYFEHDLEFNDDTLTRISFSAKRLIEYYHDLLSAIIFQSVGKLYYILELYDTNEKHLRTINVDKMYTFPSLESVNMFDYRNVLQDINDDMIQNIRYYYSGVMFLSTRLPEFAIREFYKIVEDKQSIKDEFDEHRILRNLFSHNHSVVNTASKDFCKSSIKDKFKTIDNKGLIIIDTYDFNNQGALYNMAYQLKDACKRIIFNS